MGRSNRKEHRQNTVGAPQGLISGGPQGLTSDDPQGLTSGDPQWLTSMALRVSPQVTLPQGLTHRNDNSEAIPAFFVSFLVFLPFFLCPERETS